jgi:hypothetical protein
MYKDTNKNLLINESNKILLEKKDQLSLFILLYTLFKVKKKTKNHIFNVLFNHAEIFL